MVRKALADGNGDVRASAVRLSERWLDRDAAIKAAVIALAEDKNWNVRRQVAASIGEMAAADRLAPALVLLTRDGADPIVVDAAISSLKGMEGDVLTKIMQGSGLGARGRWPASAWRGCRVRRWRCLRQPSRKAATPQVYSVPSTSSRTRRSRNGSASHCSGGWMQAFRRRARPPPVVAVAAVVAAEVAACPV